MSKRLVMGLLCMGVVAVLVVLPGTANAGVCTKPPCAGVKWFGGSCICCSTGSEIFDLTVWGVPGNLVKACAGEQCVKCSVYGTVGDSTCDPTILDPDCAIQGFAYCVNPKCVRGHQDDPECTGNFNVNGQPYVLDGVLSKSGSLTNCTKAGRCTTSVEVVGTLSDDICINPNWKFETFTASEFNGTCSFCETGYDSYGNCSVLEETTAEGFRCEVDLTQYVPGVEIPYRCCLLSELTDGKCPK